MLHVALLKSSQKSAAKVQKIPERGPGPSSAVTCSVRPLIEGCKTMLEPWKLANRNDSHLSIVFDKPATATWQMAIGPATFTDFLRIHPIFPCIRAIFRQIDDPCDPSGG